MRHVQRLGIAFLTFALGVALSPIHFYVEGRGCGKVMDGGGGFSATSYTSSYFVKLWLPTEGYGSAEKANEVFNRRLSQAEKVIEVGPKFNEDGALVGRRAMGIFYSPELSRPYTEILWTDGHFLHYISSTSTLHVREFEKQQR